MDTYNHRVTNSERFMTNCNGFELLLYCTVSNANDIFYYLTMTTNDLNMPYEIKSQTFRSTAILEKMFNMCLSASYLDNFK